MCDSQVTALLVLICPFSTLSWAGIGVAAALVSRSPAVGITAIESNTRLRSVLSINLASLLPYASSVPSPRPHIRDSPSLLDTSSSYDHEKFVVGIVARTAPGVIRLNDSCAKHFLPLVCHPTSARYIVVDNQGGNNSILHSQVIASFPQNLWTIK